MNPKYIVNTFTVSSFLIACASLLTGCGNSNSDQRDQITRPVLGTAMGCFIDSPAGISYISGGLNGVTDSQGYFEYQLVNGEPQLIDFSFNGVEIGNALGKAIITPLDLSSPSSIDDLSSPSSIDDLYVINISRFLIMLDSDGDPSNGIEASQTLIDGISQFSWGVLDFTSNDFEFSPEIINIVADINSIDTQNHSLPTIQVAQAHLRSSLSCLSSGVYAGEFDGEDHGHYVMLLQHKRTDPFVFGDNELREGVTSALIYSRDQDRLIGVVPQQGLAFNSDNSFIVGQAVNGTQFSGNLVDFSRIEDGGWSNQVEGGSGTFSGNKLAGDSSAIYRLAGAYGDDTPFDISDDTADNRGGITFDVFSDNRVYGILMSTRGDQLELNGTLTGNTIIVSSNEGTDLVIAFDRDGTDPLNSNVGLFGVSGFWGSWQRGSESGGVVGTSCQLNFE